MGGKKKKYNARFPPARIKKIMQTDEEIGKIAAPVPVVISRALELFLESLITKSVSIANEHSAKTLASSHIKHVISSNKNFDFLKSQVNLIPDLVSAEGEGQTNAQKLSSADKKTSCSASSSTANLTAGNPSSQIPKKRPRIVATPLATDDPTKTIKRKRGRPPKVKQEVNGQEADTTTDLSLPHKTAAAAIAADVKLESKNIVKTEATSSNSANSQCGAGVETAHPFHQSIFTTENTVLSKFNYSSPAAHSSSVLARYSQTGSGFGSSGMPLQLTTSSRHTTIESMYNNLSPTSQPVDLSTNSNGTQSNKAHLPHADTNNLYNAASSTPQAFDLSMRQHSAAASSTEGDQSSL
ncbi:DRAP1 [Bugula neritina]|uniref:Dr1-associated corepressor n=1 Tax=Bugula neritina TaxID=10212 RepID=A0A7J7KD78_BUGNE|nr:DRAP1 [Bugula neritina]